MRNRRLTADVETIDVSRQRTFVCRSTYTHGSARRDQALTTRLVAGQLLGSDLTSLTTPRQHIEPATKEAIITMSAHHSSAEIAQSLSISRRTCQRVKKLWGDKRVVQQKPMTTGRPRSLSPLDLAVRKYTIPVIAARTLPNST